MCTQPRSGGPGPGAATCCGHGPGGLAARAHGCKPRHDGGCLRGPESPGSPAAGRRHGGASPGGAGYSGRLGHLPAHAHPPGGGGRSRSRHPDRRVLASLRSLRGNGRQARAQAATAQAPGRSGTTRVCKGHHVGPDAGRAAKSDLEGKATSGFRAPRGLPSAGRGAETPLRRPRASPSRDPVRAGSAPSPPCGPPTPRPHAVRGQSAARKSTFQTFGKEVCLIDHSMCPVPSTVHREPICCECQAKFGGCLPVPRVKAMLPYWVPLSLRPRKQIQKMVRFYIPKTSEACPCPCHRFGGRLPMPRDQAVMPYWVPQVLRPHKKVVKRQQRCKGVQEPPLDLRSWYNRWRICCDGRLLLKWQQLQALHQHEPLAPGRGVSPPAPLLPFSLLTLLQAVLRVVVAIRHLFWV
ncbi:uncharacterized protein C16orf95 homolog isoform X1 [Eumetopias jubatus]|uniref:uncharacterized protein C16orf95 homolog isoform X1 n=1 Tax=Eumetopias jubatus TaxID=34886 RepID=UPI0010164675|nr:uncharacterized protein C16orf95 homolog isoform X1 [Eumetopias jubatus]